MIGVLRTEIPTFSEFLLTDRTFGGPTISKGEFPEAYISGREHGCLGNS